MPKKTIILNLKKWGVVIKSWTKNKKEKWKPKCNCKKEKKKINLGIDWNQDKKLSLSNLSLMIIRKQIKTKKSLINRPVFFIVVFSVLSCSLPCNCYLSNFGKTWLCYSTIIITTIYAKCAICVQCISNHVLKTLPL